MSSASLCPDVQQLQRLLLGRLPNDVRANLEEHVLHCRQCTALLPTVKADDTLVEALRAGARLALQPADRDVEALMSRLRKLRPAVPSAHETTTGEYTQGDASPMSDKPETFDFLAPAQSAGEIGRLGKYRVLKLLGQGGMGMVFQAEDPNLQRAVALKVMLPAIAVNASARERF